VGLFRRRPPDLATLLERRAQLVAELEAVEGDAAWTAASDDAEELAESRSLSRQTEALRRALADLDGQIATARDRR
jgi:NAD(P)H-dependent FMN reductase